MNIAKALAEFLAELRQTNRKLDQIIDLLKIQAEMEAGDQEAGRTYTFTIPPGEGWGSVSSHTKRVEEDE